MAEKLELDLELNDKTSQTAKKSADALRKVDENAKKAKASLDFSRELSRSEAALKKIRFDPKGYKELLEAQKQLREERKKLGAESFGEGFTKKLSFGRLAGAAAIGELMADALIEGAKGAVDLITEGVKKAFESAGKEETLRLSYKLTLGEKGSKEAREDAERVAKLAGFSASRVQEQMLPLYNAGIKPGAGARQAYALATDLAARKGTSGSGGVEEGLSAISNVYLKGGIGERQLVHLGVSRTKDLYQAIGKQLGVGVDEAKKRVTEGKVDPQLIINEMTKAVEKQQGGKAGTGGQAYGKTFESRLGRLKDLPEEFFRKMVDSPSFQKVSDSFDGLLSKLDPSGPNGSKILESLSGAFEKIGGLAEDAFQPENIEKFAKSVSLAVEAVGKLVEGLQTAINLINGEALSKHFFEGDEGDKKITEIESLKKRIANEPESGIFSGKQGLVDQLNDIESTLTPSERVDWNKKHPSEKFNTNSGGNTVHAPGMTFNFYNPTNDQNFTDQDFASRAGNAFLNHVEMSAAERSGDGSGN